MPRQLLVATLLSSSLFMTVLPDRSIAAEIQPQILLAQIYQQGIDLEQYLVSEKFDGIRAIWDGKTLRTRSGYIIATPSWFTQDFPKTPLDGELWLGRRKFDALSSAVLKDVAVDAEWQEIVYLVFELPQAKGTFEMRAKRISEITTLAHIKHLQAVPQFRVKNEIELNATLKKVVAQGGEGLMLHRADAIYVSGRSEALLKLKLAYDAEAKVIRHIAGKGQYLGKLGALEVETSDGIRFKLGTGFSNAERENPPKIGSVVTYTYRDKTSHGKPKFASFLRVRNEK